MRIIPAIDLRGGIVVRGVAGERTAYLPVVSQLVAGSEPRDIAQALREAFGLTSGYVADLDAIGGAPFNIDAYRHIAEAGLRPWIDAGLGDVDRAEQFLEVCKNNIEPEGIVVGLESLRSTAELPALLECVGPDRAIFSLDLRRGQPMTDIADLVALTPLEFVAQIAEVGFRRLIVLDLADVGMSGGVSTARLCQQVRATFPTLQITAGGGVRDRVDLLRLNQAGCDNALVASALHDGQLPAANLRFDSPW